MTASDTDGGKIYETAGTCTEHTNGSSPCDNGFGTYLYSKSYSDTCQDSATLIEYFSTAWGTCQNEIRDCGLDGCLSGACQLCFDESVLVTMADGSRKLIKDIKIGEEIKAFNEETNKTGLAIVTNIYHHKDRATKLDKVTFSNFAEFTVTPNHPILTINNGWVNVEDLKIGDRVYQLDESGKLQEVQVLSIIREYSVERTVYNLKTSLNNYFANDILVHNKCVMFGTLIDTPNGLARVENLKPGDIVYGTENGKKVETKILKAFEKEVIVDIPGKILPNGEKVTNNHLIEYKGQKIRAGETDLEDYLITGKVYDLQTETGDYYVNGIRTWFDY
jgi:hypothetical protein